MIRRSRRIQPALDQLDKRTLLSIGQLGHLVGGTAGSPLVREAKQYYYEITIATSDFAAKDVQWSFNIVEQNADKEIVEKKLFEGRTGDIGPGQLKSIESPKITSDGNLGIFEFVYKVDGKKVRAAVEAEMSEFRRTGFEGPVTVYFLPAESLEGGDE